MYTIKKATETMTSHQRVLNTFNHEKTDRVPISYMTNPTIHAKVAKLLGIGTNDSETFMQALGVDDRCVGARFIGECKFKELEGRNVNPVSGNYTRWIDNESGGYYDYCDFPLEFATDEEIASFHVPSPDEFDYDTAIEEIKYWRNRGMAVQLGGAGTGDIINSTGMVMGMENTLVNLITENEAALELIDRRADLNIAILERLFEKASDDITYLALGEDLGTQHTPMISLELYRKVLRPRHQRYVDLAKVYNKPVMIHTCGSSSWVYNDFIEMGINCVDTLQPEATNMSPRYLVDTFGKKLSYRGCISTAGPLAFGGVGDIIKDVRDTLDIMMPNRGYFFAPTHEIQDNSPPENVIAMYQEAHNYGIY